jgi:TetR/AcrR family transcriptional regulator, transcriptional repressor for nem operon
MSMAMAQRTAGTRTTRPAKRGGLRAAAASGRSARNEAVPARRQAASARDRAKAETRAALVEAALAEFAARGLDAPSLDAICARAGFTRGAFYVHFRDRDELVTAVVDRALGAFLDAIIATGDGARDLERTLRRYADAVDGIMKLRRRTDSPLPTGIPLHRMLEACERSPALRARFVALLTEAGQRVARTAAAGQRGDAVRADVPAERIGAILVPLALGFVAAVELGAPVDPVAARDALLTLLAPRDPG